MPQGTGETRPTWSERESGEAMLTVGNVYGHGFDAAQLSKIERLGFGIRPQVSRDAGAQILRFIDFERGPPLELIEVANETEYREFVPKRMVSFSPGISLVLPARSERGLTDFQEALADLRPYPLHVNYDGTSDPGKPGWNYLNFEVPVVPGVFIWLTQLDEPRPVRKRTVKHPNGVKGVRGLAFDLDDKELERLSMLVDCDIVDSALRIGEVLVWSKRALQDAPAMPDKRSPLPAIVLEAESWGPGEPWAQGARDTSFMSGPALHVATSPLSWDLLIVASGPTRNRGT